MDRFTMFRGKVFMLVHGSQNTNQIQLKLAMEVADGWSETCV